MKKYIAVIAILALCFAFTGCGGSSGYTEGEQFKLGDETYALEKIERDSDKDTDSTERYGVSLLQVGNSAPVTISGFGGGTTTTKSIIDLTLNDGETKYVTSTISFVATDEVEGYGSRVIFYFDIPKGKDFPASGTLKRTDGDETAELDLSGLKAQ